MTAAVRLALPSDRPRILTLVERAFTSPAHDGREEVGIVEDIWRLGAVVPGLDLVAAEDEELVGHVLGSRGHPGSPEFVGLAPLCVSAHRQGEGIGTALVGCLLQEAERQGWPGVVVLGDPGYYARFGFEAAGPLGITYEPAGAPKPNFQVRRLARFDPSVRGVFRYCWE